MPQITLDTKIISCPSNEPLLDSLLKANQQIPFSCRQGICQSCLMRSLDAAPPANSQTGLKDTLRQQKYFLACRCYPEQNMTVALPDQEGFKISAQVINKRLLTPDILQLELLHQNHLDFYAGQFMNLQRDDGLSRSYSIANSPNRDYRLEFHIRRLNKGQFSNWLHDDLTIGDTLTVSQAQGSCYYLPGNSEQPLLLIGTGTGLAPLIGIVKDALNQCHIGPIELFHGSRFREGLYLMDELQKLCLKHPNFRYTPCVSGEQNAPDLAQGRAHELAYTEKKNLRGWRVYLCGHPEMVAQSQKMAYLKGASLKDIYADAFLVGKTTSPATE